MVMRESLVIVGDNSGARRAKQIGLLGSFSKTAAAVGDFIIVAIQHRRLKRRFINKNIYLGLVVTRNTNCLRPQGYFIRFRYNKIVLLSEQGKVVGTRLYGPLAVDVKKHNILKLLSLAKAIL